MRLKDYRELRAEAADLKRIHKLRGIPIRDGSLVEEIIEWAERRFWSLPRRTARRVLIEELSELEISEASSFDELFLLVLLITSRARVLLDTDRDRKEARRRAARERA